MGNHKQGRPKGKEKPPLKYNAQAKHKEGMGHGNRNHSMMVVDFKRCFSSGQPGKSTSGQTL